jgi:hypothetical protein
MLILLLVGTFLRFDYIGKIYDEYDDVGVIALQKAPVDVLDKNVNFGPIKSIQFDGPYLKNIETTMLYGAFIGHGWTYAPGQYVLASFLLTNEMTAKERHLMVRSVSAFISVATILLMAVFFLKQAPPKLGNMWLILPIMSLLVFSTNTILYAMHASPYSFYSFALIAAIIISDAALKGNINFGYACIATASLCLFNYLVILVLGPFLLIKFLNILMNRRGLAWANIKKLTGWHIVQGLMVLSILMIMALFIKVGSGADSGAQIPPIKNKAEFLVAVDFLQTQFRLVAFSNLFGGMQFSWMTALLGVTVLLLSLLFIPRWILKRNYSALLSCILFGTWILLFFLNKLPFGQSRHTLMLLPPFCILLFWCVQPIISFVPSSIIMVVSMTLTLVMGITGYNNAKNAFGPRLDILTKDSISIYDPDLVLTYGFTLGPMVDFFEDEKVIVLNLDFKSAQLFDWDIVDDNKRIIIASQTEPMTKEQLADLTTKYPKLFNKRSISTLKEKTTEVFFPFHSYPISSNQNGAYIYEMLRK